MHRPRSGDLNSSRLHRPPAGVADFSESETSERTQIFGNIAQRVSTYQKSGSLDGVAFTTRGVKTFQFLRTRTGWRILSVSWDDERDGLAVAELS